MTLFLTATGQVAAGLESLQVVVQFDWKPLRENLELHTGPDCVEQCGGRVLLHGRGGYQGQGRADGCSRD